MKKARMISAVLTVVVMGVMVQPTFAQSCPCDCYFSGDCQSEMFCNWGNLSIEDSCFWRTPKPQGSPGAGCDEDYGNWGQCDGICTASASATPFTPENIPDLIAGVKLWAAAFGASGRDGGGFPDQEILAGFDDIQYSSPEMVDDVGRIVAELMMLSRGPEFINFPQTDSFVTADVMVNDLSGASCTEMNGELAVAALIMEIIEAGSGADIAAYIDERCLDTAMFEDICGDSADAAHCLYGQIAVFGDALGRAGRTETREYAGLGGGGSCSWPVQGDLNGDNNVDIEDVLVMLAAWGNCPNPADQDPMACPADYDEDEIVGTNDLLMLLAEWT